MTLAKLSNLFVGIATFWIATAPFAAIQAFKYQGFNLIAFSKVDYANEDLVKKSLDHIVWSGSNFVDIDWMVAVDDDGKVIPQSSPASFEPPLSDIVRVVVLAHQRGLKVFLKPHVGFPNDPFGNRGSWNTNMTKFSLDAFFHDWANYLTDLGSVATSLGVDGLVIGTENIGFDSTKCPQWVSLIASIRQVFAGKITYDAHFSVQYPWEVTNVCFWDFVDIIGLSLYVPLSKDDQASLQELNAAWHSNPYGSFGDIIEFLHSLSTKYNKPVMALEGGYQSIAGALFDVGPVGEGRPVNNAVQAAGFSSYLDTLGKYQGDWFWGMSIWTVFPPMMDPVNQVGWGYAQGYMTNGKPAADVIRKYFTGAISYSDPTFSGGDGADRVFGSYANDSITGNAGDDFLWGGTGDDSIVAGPAALSTATAASVIISATGDVRPSGGPRLRLQVNGEPVGNWTEVTAQHGTPPQALTFTVGLAQTTRIDSFRIESQPDPEFANGVNRSTHVAAISVNGLALSEADGTYTAGTSVTKGVGSWFAIWPGTALDQYVAPYQALFYGATTDSDVVLGGPGDDMIDGGTGVDAAGYSGRFADYTITKTANGYIVHDNVGADGTDTLINIEILQFSDRVVDLRSGGRRTIPVVEFYNASLDHYFITWIPLERTNLYLRRTPTSWIATGLSFNTFAESEAGTSPVCRYYLPPQFGDSHFFGRGSAECLATGQQHPAFVLEDSQFMNMYLPNAGGCPAATIPIYRVFSNRTDANHRYTTDKVVRDSMVAKGWLAEGDGPDLVVMCAPI